MVAVKLLSCHFYNALGNGQSMVMAKEVIVITAALIVVMLQFNFS